MAELALKKRHEMKATKAANASRVVEGYTTDRKLGAITFFQAILCLLFEKVAIIATLQLHSEAIMKSVNIADLKNNLSRYLNDVRQGEEILIKDRNTPVARIMPFAAESEDEEIMELAARGLISLPDDEGFPRDFFTQPLPKVKGVDVLKMLRDERDKAHNPAS